MVREIPKVAEERVTIAGADVNLEGRLAPGTAPDGIVITHPHPLYGGTMDNNVVWTVAKAFQSRDWTTLRFNFRGVGLSSGEHGDGLAELADVQAAVNFLASRVPGRRFLAGYSFGAAVGARALVQGVSVAGAILIAPPIGLMDMDFLPRVPKLRLIVVGDRDEFCPLDRLEKLLPPAAAGGPEIRVIPNCSHFFAGRERQLYDLLAEFPLD